MEAVGELTRELGRSFDAGKSRSYEWRIAQLRSMVKMCVDNDNEEMIVAALKADLDKPELR